MAALITNVAIIFSMLLCPQGSCFSLSGLSAESEKKNQLCVLGALSAAGGETKQSTKKLCQIRIYINYV